MKIKSNEKRKRGRPQSVSKWLSKNELKSIVKPNSSGAYIPVPQEIVGKEVFVYVVQKNGKQCGCEIIDSQGVEGFCILCHRKELNLLRQSIADEITKLEQQILGEEGK